MLGLTKMSFYGVAGTLTAIFLWGSIALDIGGGYNEFNQETGESTIFRWGYPGKNRQIEVKNPLKDIQGVRVDIKDGINPRRTLFIRVKGRREIPLTRVGELVLRGANNPSLYSISEATFRGDLNGWPIYAVEY